MLLETTTKLALGEMSGLLNVRPFQVISLFLVNLTLKNLPGNQEEKNKPPGKKHNRNTVFSKRNATFLRGFFLGPWVRVM